MFEGKDHATLYPFNALIPKVKMALTFRKKAFYVVKEWEEAQELSRCVVSDDQAFWWGALYNEFILQLADIFPILEALQALRGRLGSEPEQILIDTPALSVSTYATAMAICFPQARIFVKRRRRDQMIKVASQHVRIWRKRAGEARLRALPPRGSRPRVLLSNTEPHWLGGRDKDLWPVEQALRAQGIEVVTLASACGVVGKDLNGFLSRPKDHIFADIIDPLIGRPRRENLPIAPGRFVCDGIDFSPFVLRWSHFASRLDTALLDQRWTDVITQIAPDYVLMANAHCEWGALSRAAASAGVKSCIIQHGRLTPHHPLYIIPPCAESAYPRPNKVFVYSRVEAGTLKEHSNFKPESIVIVGSPEWDPILKTNAHFRGAPLVDSPSRQRPLRWLFTSQPGLDEKTMRLLAQGVASRPADALRIRLHPREDSTRSWRRILAEYRLEADLVKKTPLEEDLAWCDTHLTFCSTCLLHAVVAGRPSILLGEIDDPWRDQFVTAGVGRKAASLEQLAEAVAIWSSAEGQAEFATRREALLRELEIEPISSGQRIARALYPARVEQPTAGSALSP